MYCVIEGGDGCGKTTQAKLLADRLQQNNYEVFLTKEPGSSDPLCRQIRQLLLNPENNIDPAASLCLFLADRSQHMRAIKQALDEGKVVISDRSGFSSFVYYAAAQIEQDPLEIARQISPLLDFAQQIRPDWCFVCTADFEWSRARLKERATLDRIEQLGEDFHKRTHRFFQQLYLRELQTNMENAPERLWFCPPAQEKTQEQIHQEIYNKLLPQLLMKTH